MCANVIVGNELPCRISGSQKSEEAPHHRCCSWIDEISTDLDSSTTFQIVKCIQQIVHLGEATALAFERPDEAWALLSDFCSLDRWVSTVRTCRRVEEDEEEEGRPGRCEGPVNMAAPGEAVGWSKERLLETDHAGRWYSYEVVESNKGVRQVPRHHAGGARPRRVRRRVVVRGRPVKGWTQEGFVGFLEKLARGVARRLEEEINDVVKGDGV
ncbi:hypothetical protein BAE44_0024064 [Dichanthelium oligosanthes]|uniref:Uncharacterized protein n=1 Tax=Dichanthelium oligosanthes TaxID=888268 RepID=A0A1E5UPX2_9POAL|nr:hypothetical protein BAE44_0024064 [Dichanthelium oligosanthes]